MTNLECGDCPLSRACASRKGSPECLTALTGTYVSEFRRVQGGLAPALDSTLKNPDPLPTSGSRRSANGLIHAINVLQPLPSNIPQRGR